MDEWIPIVVLPNVDFRGTLECEFAAIVSSDDLRIDKLRKDHPRFEKFLSRFSEQFGEQVWPSIMILSHDAPDSYRTAEAITAFRDILSVSVVALARSRRLRHKQPNPFIFSTPFQLYPWMIDAQYDDVILINPAQKHFHDLDLFHGHTFPEQSQISVSDSELDHPVRTALLDRWNIRFSDGSIEWKEKALFRSLNMANEAAAIHALTASTFYDVGRSLALWVSAYEILAHPGGLGQSNFSTVTTLLESVHWLDNKLSQATHEIHGNPPQQKQLATWICKRLYNARNDFLHGNDVEGPSLLLNGNVIIDYAPCVFRMALTSFLDLQFKDPSPPIDDAQAFGEHIAKHMSYYQFQKSFEAALLTAI